ncbi:MULTISPECIES: hypothetical protein [unclassified Streptomyces]|uniref:hypothetical protein n=1 Tax=unclassified Streptomyces TaxID=2593676 RepID=UPI0035D9384B
MLHREITQPTAVVVRGLASLAHQSRDQSVSLPHRAFRPVHEMLLNAPPFNGVLVAPFGRELLDLKPVVAFLAGGAELVLETTSAGRHPQADRERDHDDRGDGNSRT